ncbi:uncharacterized protein N7459_005650 [Penicillium hispanicum]|uniref:uncharacterized protein n=1 Tax=Penicillium hispanicum TaxID=1080232 RepID=UPI002540092F|nr:uncharacterized protein N7459_005650 [Penicillium hispanicum]KAJ5579665.1 hypothetical protein N7459_005650 [Penicillium hispanicum]
MCCPCPTDFGDDWQRKSLRHRGGALFAALLGAIIYAVKTESPRTIQLMLPAIWSFVEGVLRQSRIKVPLPIQALFDFASVVWLGMYASVLVFSWLWEPGSGAFFVAASLLVAMYFHGSLCLRAAVQFLEESRDPSRDAIDLSEEV